MQKTINLKYGVSTVKDLKEFLSEFDDNDKLYLYQNDYSTTDENVIKCLIGLEEIQIMVENSIVSNKK